MADSLDAPSSPLTSSNRPKNDKSSNVNRKRGASEELDENSNAKTRRTSVEQSDGLTSSTPLIDANSNNADTTTSSSDDNNSTISATNMTALEGAQLRDQNSGTTTAVALSSLLTNQQQQHFLQTYAQASGQDLAQLTASSLAQAMVSPISVPGFNLLQQLQAGSVITALPGPPGDFGLGGHHRWTQQHPPFDSSNGIKDGRRTSTADVNPSGGNNTNDITTIAAKDMTGPSDAAARIVSNDERRQRRLLRNRVAAKECRKKKKKYIQDMEIKIMRLEDQNAALQKEIDDIHNKLALSTMQGRESYRLMKEVEELNAKLGIGHLSTTGSSLTTKDEMETTATASSSLGTTDISPANGLSTAVVSAMASTQQHTETNSSTSASSSASLPSASSLPLSTPIPTSIPTSADASSTTSTATNQPIKSLPASSPFASTASIVSSSSSLSSPSPNSKVPTTTLNPLEHSASSPTNVLHATESAIKIGDMDQQRKEINVE